MQLPERRAEKHVHQQDHFLVAHLSDRTVGLTDSRSTSKEGAR